ncbi:MAG TPA: DUF177 domain-containing protein [Pseudolabrys sp.]|nr:DUF177 domain-containing protein [Pseudolabrys sp.]
MKVIEQPWSVPIAVEDIPGTGEHVDLEAPEDVRNALAKVGGLRSLYRLVATFDLEKQGRSVHVKGEVNASVGQTCVVTLEPIENEINESIDLLFAPGAADTRGIAEGRAVRSADDGPEPLVGGIVDLGALTTEFLLLGIDPYPRKSGAQFAPPKSEQSGSHPFAALEVLKKKRSARGKS